MWPSVISNLVEAIPALGFDLSDFYGAPPGDWDRSIRQAYRCVARSAHPDHNPGNSTAHFRMVRLGHHRDELLQFCRLWETIRGGGLGFRACEVFRGVGFTIGLGLGFSARLRLSQNEVHEFKSPACWRSSPLTIFQQSLMIISSRRALEIPVIHPALLQLLNPKLKYQVRNPKP